MLVLTRKVGETIVVGESVSVVVQRISGNRVALGISAPSSVHILRGELAAASDKAGGDQTAEDRADGGEQFTVFLPSASPSAVGKTKLPQPKRALAPSVPR